ncbi:MAG: hypothetical protein NTY25_01640, partial [Planctomycetia bacterium]|nr:hypothetical protein [Planctomycetia bacterium]
RSGNRFLGRGKPGRREQPAHESLSSRATLVEVPLTGLSFARQSVRCKSVSEPMKAMLTGSPSCPREVFVRCGGSARAGCTEAAGSVWHTAGIGHTQINTAAKLIAKKIFKSRMG